MMIFDAKITICPHQVPVVECRNDEDSEWRRFIHHQGIEVII